MRKVLNLALLILLSSSSWAFGQAFVYNFPLGQVPVAYLSSNTAVFAINSNSPTIAITSFQFVLNVPPDAGVIFNGPQDFSNLFVQSSNGNAYLFTYNGNPYTNPISALGNIYITASQGFFANSESVFATINVSFLDTTLVPEPKTYLILGSTLIGVLGLTVFNRKRIAEKP